jgi:hypothetical protein
VGEHRNGTVTLCMWVTWEDRWVSTPTASYKGHRYPVEIINHCVWLYFWFPLSFREVEELMLARGVVVLGDDPALVCQVRAGLRQPAAAAAPAFRRQVTSRRAAEQHRLYALWAVGLDDGAASWRSAGSCLVRCRLRERPINDPPGASPGRRRASTRAGQDGTLQEFLDRYVISHALRSMRRCADRQRVVGGVGGLRYWVISQR